MYCIGIKLQKFKISDRKRQNLFSLVKDRASDRLIFFVNPDIHLHGAFLVTVIQGQTQKSVLFPCRSQVTASKCFLAEILCAKYR